MIADPIYCDLRNILADLYAEEEDARRIVSDAGLNARNIRFNTNAANFWHSILTEAQKNESIDKVIYLALSDYKDNLALRNAVNAYQERINTSRLPKQAPINNISEAYRVSEIDDSDASYISPFSPLLTGIVIDLSRSMIDIISNLPKRSNISKQRLLNTFNIIVEKAVTACRTPESKEVFPSFALFIYGYGFSHIRKNLFGFLNRVVAQSPNTTVEKIPAEPVRDLFAEMAEKENLPVTPDIATLNTYWNYYKESIEAQALDMGAGHSNLYQSMRSVYERFTEELTRPFYRYPLLILITDGQLGDATDKDLDRIMQAIKELGVTVICLYIGPKTLTSKKQLYAKPNLDWPIEAIRLFNCSSNFSRSHYAANSIFEYMEENGWLLPDNAKLFIQLNNGAMLNEFAEIILSPLRD